MNLQSVRTRLPECLRRCWRRRPPAVAGAMVLVVNAPAPVVLAAVGEEPVAELRPLASTLQRPVAAVVRVPVDTPNAANGLVSPAAIEQWVRELDADSYLVRRRAEMQLIAAGPTALAAVASACENPSAEVRSRARRIMAVVRFEQLAAGFRTLGEMPDAAIDIEGGMILISQLIDPATDPVEIRRQFDAWADEVRQRLGGMDPRTVTPQQAVEAHCQTLFGPAGLAGASTNFDDPRNSALSQVIKRQMGLPIVLSHVAVAVGTRLGLPLEGVALPYRYMFKYDGSRAPAGFPRTDIIVDAFGGGRIVNEDDLEDIITGLGGGFDPLRHLQNCPRRETLARMLRNVESQFAKAGELLKAFQAATFRRLLVGPTANVRGD